MARVRIPQLILLILAAPVIYACSRTVVDLYNYEEDVPFEEACFQYVGCFNNSLTSHQPGFPPQSPERIGTIFYLYNRDHRSDHVERLEAVLDDQTLHHFNRHLQTKILIHGFNENSEMSNYQEMKRALLIKGDFNIIIVDYTRGARGSFNKVRQNALVLGRQLARLLRAQESTYQVELSSFHIIGHSLGAHIAGYAGQDLRAIGRITGLDPAGPGFFEQNPLIRLDPSDAEFVDVIHTNSEKEGAAFGLHDPLGHADFYPNGGSRMPWCGNYFTLICNHQSSAIFFTNSILGCQLSGYFCESYEMYNQGLCETSCENNRCAVMGYNAQKDENAGPNTFYLSTSSYSPYCME